MRENKVLYTYLHIFCTSLNLIHFTLKVNNSLFPWYIYYSINLMEIVNYIPNSPAEVFIYDCKSCVPTTLIIYIFNWKIQPAQEEGLHLTGSLI